MAVRRSTSDLRSQELPIRLAQRRRIRKHRDYEGNSFSLFPSEMRFAEVTVVGCAPVDWLEQIEPLDDCCRPVIELRRELFCEASVAGAAGVNSDRHRLRHADRVGNLDFHLSRRDRV